jgi:hypothetical protein
VDVFLLDEKDVFDLPRSKIACSSKDFWVWKDGNLLGAARATQVHGDALYIC